MNTKTMEGLIGAGTNMDLVNTPMRVYKDARRKGDTGTMERARGYVNEFAGKAEEYRVQADAGMREETERAREEAELEREKAIEKRREERWKLEEELAARREEHRNSAEGIDDTAANPRMPEKAVDGTGNPIDRIADTLEISEEGKELSDLNVSVSEE